MICTVVRLGGKCKFYDAGSLHPFEIVAEQNGIMHFAV